MSAYAERRNIMDKLFTSPVSIEQFAAYLDGNLSDSQMNEMDMLITSNPVLEELAEMSDIIAEDTQLYLNDDFAYETDMTMLNEQDFDIPCIDIEDELVADIARIYENAEIGNDIMVAAAISEPPAINFDTLFSNVAEINEEMPDILNNINEDFDDLDI